MILKQQGSSEKKKKKKIKGTAFYWKSHCDLFFNTFPAKVTELSIKLWQNTPHERKKWISEILQWAIT